MGKLFNRYIWSIETLIEYQETLRKKDLTDTFGVLKPKNVFEDKINEY